MGRMDTRGATTLEEPMDLETGWAEVAYAAHWLRSPNPKTPGRGEWAATAQGERLPEQIGSPTVPRDPPNPRPGEAKPHAWS